MIITTTFYTVKLKENISVTDSDPIAFRALSIILAYFKESKQYIIVDTK
ncbi:unnamed protein product, partial [Didymodactylos carnosus]